MASGAPQPHNPMRAQTWPRLAYSLVLLPPTLLIFILVTWKAKVGVHDGGGWGACVRVCVCVWGGGVGGGVGGGHPSPRR
jgi:hypothetical protein